MRKFNKNRKKLTIFILLSLLFHVALILIPWSKRTDKKPPVFVVERITLPPERQQVVDDTKMANEETPEEDRLLSKKNNRVKEQTKARQIAKTQNSRKSVIVKKDNKKAEKTKPKKRLSMSDLALKPQQRSPSSYSPPSTTDDYLPDVKEGTDTSLNTREFQFYSYFERIKDRLRMYWEPQLKARVNQLYARGQSLPNHDVMTKLYITLDKNGELSKISIIKDSGIEDVDGAAIKAFELAAPFPNPPSGMIEKNGKVRLTWSFVVETRGIADIFVFLSKR